MPTFEIPLTAQSQTFRVELAKVTYNMALLWCNGSDSWTLDIADKDGVPILRGLPLVADTDLLAPYPYLNFGGQLIASTDDLPGIAPTYENLGGAGKLYFVTP